MDQNDIFEISKFAIFFVLSLSNRIISGGPQYRETCHKQIPIDTIRLFFLKFWCKRKAYMHICKLVIS